jgi:hypothetical protein
MMISLFKPEKRLNLLVTLTVGAMATGGFLYAMAITATQ